mmetsp:Transcript_90039/g.259527  ORF Transcript_90039/g.259527 Transcript_90039/m.259527 type:complete len:149 (-) Transcript_90039:21-467(-)
MWQATGGGLLVWLLLLTGVSHSSGRSLPDCSCACCSAQLQDRRGTQSGSGDRVCAPLYYSQPFLHRGFADCRAMALHRGGLCVEHRFDNSIVEYNAHEVDAARFCFQYCMPSSYPSAEDVGNGGECVPVTAEALRAMGAASSRARPVA